MCSIVCIHTHNNLEEGQMSVIMDNICVLSSLCSQFLIIQTYSLLKLKNNILKLHTEALMNMYMCVFVGRRFIFYRLKEVVNPQN